MDSESSLVPHWQRAPRRPGAEEGPLLPLLGVSPFRNTASAGCQYPESVRDSGSLRLAADLCLKLEVAPSEAGRTPAATSWLTGRLRSDGLGSLKLGWFTPASAPSQSSRFGPGPGPRSARLEWPERHSNRWLGLGLAQPEGVTVADGPRALMTTGRSCPPSPSRLRLPRHVSKSQP